MTDIQMRPVAGEVEERALPEAPLSVEGRTLVGLIPYDQLSHEMPGGWRERYAPGAFSSADKSRLVVRVDHEGLPLGRFPTTLSVQEHDHGLAWSCPLPESPLGETVRVAVARGDLAGTSHRFVCGRDSWQGDTRTIHEVRSLFDVSVVQSPAFQTRAELRSLEPEPAAELDSPAEPEPEPVELEPTTDPEEALVPTDEPQGPGLTVESRSASDRPTGSLADRFRQRGFPGERATLPFGEVFEDRALTWSGNVAVLNPTSRPGVPLGADQRYAWPAFASVAVDAGTTAVTIPRQSARALAAAADVVRNIDAVTRKPETSSTLELLTVPLKQVASVQSGIPNVYLQTQVMGPIVEVDLRLSVNAGLDALVINAIATAGHQDPTSDGSILVTIRKAIATLQAAGYNPDTLILDPASAVAIDTARATQGDNFFIFAPGSFAPGQLFGLTRRTASGIPAPVVVDSSAFGRMYASPVSLARFEENAGGTNTSLIRLELDAVFGTERPAAAVRIAAS